MAQQNNNGQNWFAYHEDYPVMGGALGTPPISVGTPALLWHSAFWIPNSYSEKPLNPASPDVPHDEWVEEIERFVLKLYDNLVASGQDGRAITSSWHQPAGEEPRLYLFRNWWPEDPVNRTSTVIVPHAVRNQSVNLSFSWKSMQVNMDIDLYPEYVTMSAAIDLSGKPLQGTEKDKPKTIACELGDAIRLFNTIATERFQKVANARKQVPGSEQPNTVDEDKRRFEDIYRLFNERLWTAFYGEVIREPFNAIGADKIGKPFSDSRTFVATLGDSASSFIALPQEEGRLHAGIAAPSRVFEHNEDLDCVNTILPFMAVGGDPKQQEHSYSKFLGGHCFFATTLGAPPAEPSVQAKYAAHLLLFTHQDSLQIGRLVDLGDKLGDFRLAAIYDLEHIIRAGYRIRGLDEELRNDVGNIFSEGLLGIELSKIKQWLKQPPKEEEKRKEIEELIDREIRRNRENNVRYFADRLGQIATALAQIGNDPITKKPLIYGGLARRVERSRDYHRQFQSMIESLHSEAIENFQPYPQFVERRLSHTHAQINFVGERREQLERTIISFTEQVRTAETTQMTDSSLRLQRAGTALTRVVTGGFVALGAPLTISQLFPDYIGKSEKIYLVILGGAGVLLGELHRIGFRRVANEILKTSERINLRMERLNRTARERRENEADSIIARALVEPRRTHPRSRRAYKSLWPES